MQYSYALLTFNITSYLDNYGNKVIPHPCNNNARNIYNRTRKNKM